jgi:hypothetical protein
VQAFVFLCGHDSAHDACDYHFEVQSFKFKVQS